MLDNSTGKPPTNQTEKTIKNSIKQQFSGQQTSSKTNFKIFAKLF